MREAFGGVFLVKIMMIFLVIYIIFIAMAFNYAKTFRTKNGIVDYIEKCEGDYDCAKDDIEAYLDRIGYYVPSQGPGGSYASTHDNATCYDRGYCIELINDSEKEGRVDKRVVTFIQFNFLGIDDKYNFSGMDPMYITIKGDIQDYIPESYKGGV